MRHRRATNNDIPKVFENLAGRLGDEYHISKRHQTDPDISRERAIRKAKKMFRDAVQRGEADALLEDSRPIALVGWIIQNGEVHTVFASAEEFFSTRYVRSMRKYVSDLQKRLNGAPLVASNWTGRDDVGKWFRLLGYRFYGDYGPAKVFVLQAADN